VRIMSIFSISRHIHHSVVVVVVFIISLFLQYSLGDQSIHELRCVNIVVGIGMTYFRSYGGRRGYRCCCCCCYCRCCCRRGDQSVNEFVSISIIPIMVTHFAAVAAVIIPSIVTGGP